MRGVEILAEERKNVSRELVAIEDEIPTGGAGGAEPVPTRDIGDSQQRFSDLGRAVGESLGNPGRASPNQERTESIHAVSTVRIVWASQATCLSRNDSTGLSGRRRRMLDGGGAGGDGGGHQRLGR